MTSVLENSTASETPYTRITSSNPEPNTPSIPKGVDIKPPQCYKCGKIDMFKFHKLIDGHIYCSKCTEELANETIKKQQVKDFLDSCIPDELKDK